MWRVSQAEVGDPPVSLYTIHKQAQSNRFFSVTHFLLAVYDHLLDLYENQKATLPDLNEARMVLLQEYLTTPSSQFLEFRKPLNATQIHQQRPDFLQTKEADVSLQHKWLIKF